DRLPVLHHRLDHLSQIPLDRGHLSYLHEGRGVRRGKHLPPCAVTKGVRAGKPVTKRPTGMPDDPGDRSSLDIRADPVSWILISERIHEDTCNSRPFAMGGDQPR